MGLVGTWKLRWETWDLRGVILLSLCLQILMIFLAPLRKRVSKALLNTPLWLAYLLADVTASFAVGLISNSQGDTSGPFADPTILAFWAPFLLVHLGGPDTITAFALEDNELWLRHLLGLGFQCWAVGYAFFQSFPNHKFWIPTSLMFAVGIIKYIERTRALYLASSGRFKDSLLREPDPGPNYAKLMDEYTSKMEANLPTKIEMIPEPPTRPNKTKNAEGMKTLKDVEMVQVAYDYFSKFKGLIADLIFSFRERNQSRDFFLNLSPRDAFKVVEVELNFFYEILYTKATVVQSKLGYCFRIISFILNCAALVTFCLIEKKKFKKFDIGISYTLLLGAIALDIIAFVMVLCSDWTAVALTKLDPPNWFIGILPKWFTRILQWLLKVNRERWPSDPGRKLKWFSPKKIMQIIHLRWSESLSQYNFMNYCLHPRAKLWEKTIGFVGLTNMLDGLKYVKPEDFTDDLRDFIFKELRMKSESADDSEMAKEIFAARGDWILRYEGHSSLLCWINEVDFDESIILWHIATELCYYSDEQVEENPEDKKKLSMILSDYLLYLLIMQSTMLSTVAGIGKIRFRDTLAEAKKFFCGKKILEDGKNSYLNVFNLRKYFCCCFSKCHSNGENGPDDLHIQACKSILEVNTVVKPVAVKGDRSKSVLFDACMLAKELKKLERTEMWEIISKVWVEILSYAASHCRANTHVAQLSKGGQLLTLVWLLMAHLGLGDQFQISEGHARAKLIVTKSVNKII